jgi:predicted amidohydrolase
MSTSPVKVEIPPQYDNYKQEVQISVVNFKPVWGDKETNLKKMEDFIAKAAEKGTNIIIFSEMSLQGYLADPQDPGGMQRKLAETIPGLSTLRLAQSAAKYDIYIIAGMSERDTSNPTIIYNSAVIIAPEGILGSYRKVHPWQSELVWCNRGDEFPVWETRYGPIGVIICYDIYFIPEEARIYAIKGARLLACCTAAPSEPGCELVTCEETTTILKIRSLENLLFIANAGTIENNFDRIIAGNSVILGPNLEGPRPIDFYAGPPTDPMKEELLTAQLDFRLIHRAQSIMPSARRPELYGLLTT